MAKAICELKLLALVWSALFKKYPILRKKSRKDFPHLENFQQEKVLDNHKKAPPCPRNEGRVLSNDTFIDEVLRRVERRGRVKGKPTINGILEKVCGFYSSELGDVH
jgi:hypothetical protein